MARYKLYLIERPRRWTPALEAIVADASGPPRERVEGFLAGSVEGPVLLVASDDHALITGHWERCDRDRLAVCIFDHSTLWDRLRDRLRPRPAVAPGALDAQPQTPPPSVSDAREAPRFALSLRTRATLMAACAFVALLGVALLVVPRVDHPADAPPAAGTDATARTGADAPRLPAPGRGGGGGASRGAEGGGGRDTPRGGARSGCATSPARDASTSPGALLFAFVLGWALAWGAGLLVERRGGGISTAHLRVARQLATFAAALLAVFSVLLKLSAISAAREVAPDRDTPAESAEEDGAAPPDASDPGGPFARFLHRRRAPLGPGGFRGLLDRWRNTRDGGADVVDAAAGVESPGEATEGESPGAALDAGAARRERHRRHERRSGRHHASSRDAGGDASPDATDAVSLDAARDDGVAVTDIPGASAGPRAGPSAPNEGGADDVAPPSAAPPRAPRRAAPRAARAPRPPDPPPRAPLSPVSCFAAGVAAGLLLSPRWRALARGER
jgi:hypothetical protein